MAAIELTAPALRTIAKELLALIKSDETIRRIQGANAPRACYFERTTLTAAAQYPIVQAQAGNEIFSSLVITFDTAAGLGSYRVDGIAPATAGAGLGVEIPAGGGILIIEGNDNIKGFSMIAQAGQTLPFARYLYK